MMVKVEVKVMVKVEVEVKFEVKAKVAAAGECPRPLRNFRKDRIIRNLHKWGRDSHRLRQRQWIRH